jgi:hypothetical protein
VQRLFALTAALTVATSASFAFAERGKLPPETLRGPAQHLHQYPSPGLATNKQRIAAQRLLAKLREATLSWRDPVRAESAGFRVRRKVRSGRSAPPLWLHAERVAFRRDHRYLDPGRPDTIIYADVVGRPLVLIGVMFSMPRGMRGPTPGGPITRWHSHLVCARDDARGIAPRSDGSCPRGMRKRLGSEMMHVWFTRDLRSSFAIHAPVPELCAARYLPARHCRGHERHG